jgi:hypothetical protein
MSRQAKPLIELLKGETRFGRLVVTGEAEPVKLNSGRSNRYEPLKGSL